VMVCIYGCVYIWLCVYMVVCIYGCVYIWLCVYMVVYMCQCQCQCECECECECEYRCQVALNGHTVDVLMHLCTYVLMCL
ncbi:hypothetical protein B484DRAFT_319043, partial [Ochromonadaceae sp. CCMP2298]